MGAYHSKLISVQMSILVNVTEVPDLQGKEQQGLLGGGTYQGLLGEEGVVCSTRAHQNSDSEYMLKLKQGNQNALRTKSADSLKNHHPMKYYEFQEPFCHIMFMIFSNK